MGRNSELSLVHLARSVLSKVGTTQILQYANGKQPVGEIRDSMLQNAVNPSQAKIGLNRLEDSLQKLA